MGKNDEVFELMRHLPYIWEDCLLAPESRVANWPTLLERMSFDHIFETEGPEGIRIITEGLDWPNIPSSAFSLTCGGRNNCVFILDTKYGTVHTLNTPEFVHPSKPPLTARNGGSDPFEFCVPGNEQGWRSNTSWSIPDFFDVLKNEYVAMRYLPYNDDRIEELYDNYGKDEIPSDSEILYGLVKEIYEEHGWPDLSVYDKEKCWIAVDKLIKDRFPKEDY
ncbi:unnamed protein product [Aureobasidium uvarum]|uniref:Uncharacterized protein n=1 Tax=Aureobasidium uvarum TaxID=2773716 RepID=A0A9N8KYL5_9PEZI|nr:unnamed protein product [Aureobasidium uvarum]